MSDFSKKVEQAIDAIENLMTDYDFLEAEKDDEIKDLNEQLIRADVKIEELENKIEELEDKIWNLENENE